MAPSGAPTTAVQLSQNQIEEAKLMTAGKMRIYRKDRLYANDKDKTECLVDCLKNVRITDEATYFNSQKTNDRQSSPPHSPNVGHRSVLPRSGTGGGGPSGAGGGGSSSIGGGSSVKGSGYTPSGDSKQRGQSGNHSTTDYSSSKQANS